MYTSLVLCLWASIIFLNHADEKEIDEGKDEKDSYALLEEIEMPENCQMDGIEYLGPPIDNTVF